ncbi:hypothetical protein MIND_01164200 [Mycena indigotica]|uniref:RING-CH-type domain-containing protein n=1 Tax=Mycena indigotica TaxID=2126181 RepID=A0A8H6S7C0_9AGAR|nr:uncharacterized protein MIND_01164200 [Mycena indigotica]KAF7292660.1 hypothetical protein MIND_01164200 [Mycena indigotica]
MSTPRVPTIDDIRLKRCFICLEETVAKDPWVHPCPTCAPLAHESCLIRWTASLPVSPRPRTQNQTIFDLLTLRCPRCLRPYELAEPLTARVHTAVILLNTIYRTLGTLVDTFGAAEPGYGVVRNGGLRTGVFEVLSWGAPIPPDDTQYDFRPPSLTLHHSPDTAIPSLVAWNSLEMGFAAVWGTASPALRYYADRNWGETNGIAFFDPNTNLDDCLEFPFSSSTETSAMAADSPFSLDCSSHPSYNPSIIRSERVWKAISSDVHPRCCLDGTLPSERGRAAAGAANDANNDQAVIALQDDDQDPLLLATRIIHKDQKSLTHDVVHAISALVLPRAIGAVLRRSWLGAAPRANGHAKEETSATVVLKTFAGLFLGGVGVWAEDEPVWWQTSVGWGIYVIAKDALALTRMYFQTAEVRSRAIKSRDFAGVDVRELDLVEGWEQDGA